jgi:hypothetical protein
MLVSGYLGMWMNFQKMKASGNALAEFTSRYQDSNDYNALFRKASSVYEEANFLQREYTAFPASGVTLGIVFILWAFDRRKMLKKYNELKMKLE